MCQAGRALAQVSTNRADNLERAIAVFHGIKATAAQTMPLEWASAMSDLGTCICFVFTVNEPKTLNWQSQPTRVLSRL